MVTDDAQCGEPDQALVASRAKVLQRAAQMPQPVGLPDQVGVQRNALHQGLIARLVQHCIGAVDDHLREVFAVHLARHDHGNVVELLRVGHRPQALPIFAFRVSAVDEIVDIGMLAYAQKTFNAKKPGLILVNNPWSESNERGLKAAMSANGVTSAGIEKFEGNDIDMVPQLTRLRAAGADTLFMVGNVGPSAQVIKSLERMGWKVPVVSHWGLASGRFTELAGPTAKEVHFVQTYSFFGKQGPVGERVIKAMMAKYPNVKTPADITPAVGVANAHDATHLAALAIQAAGSTQGDAVRQGFYKIDKYEGLIKTYTKPFSPGVHDAVTSDDYVWAQFIDNRIVPVDQTN